MTRLIAVTLVIITMLATNLHAADYKFKDINYPPAVASVPVSISSDGSLVLGDDTSIATYYEKNKFIYNTVTYTYLPLDIEPTASTFWVIATGINSHGTVVGGFFDDHGSHGFIYRDEEVQTCGFSRCYKPRRHS